MPAAKSALRRPEPGYEIDLAGVSNTPAVKAEMVRWVEATRNNLRPFAHGVYVNQLGDTSDQLLRSGMGRTMLASWRSRKNTTPAEAMQKANVTKPSLRPFFKAFEGTAQSAAHLLYANTRQRPQTRT